MIEKGIIAKDGHQYNLINRIAMLPVLCAIFFPDDSLDLNLQGLTKRLESIKKRTKSPYVVFCLRCSDHPNTAYAKIGKRDLEWWIETLSKSGFKYDPAYTEQVSDGTDWHGIIVCKVQK